jgi:hypothetical protein
VLTELIELIEVIVLIELIEAGYRSTTARLPMGGRVFRLRANKGHRVPVILLGNLPNPLISKEAG